MSTVLVTGVGAIMGYGLLKSIRAAAPHIRLVGTDIYDDAAGRAWCDSFEQAPLTSSPDYPSWLEKVIKTHSVDLLIPGIEQDLHWLSEHREQVQALGCRIVLNNRELIELSRDKWLMDQALSAIAEPCRIPSLLNGSFDELVAQLGLPFLLKPRRSYASKGLVWVRQRADFEPHADALGKELMAQPIIGSADQEYTVAVFGDGEGGSFGTITLQRKLAADGSTAKAWVREDDSLDQAVARLCHHFKPVGPTNLQFRRAADGQWKLLEINPRISSTSSMRRAFGFNEAAMCLAFFLENQPPERPVIRPGFAVRYIEDYVVYDRDHF
ncbi:TPA: ATP-grasp domain-containing protein [Pseudomonas putida]